MNIVTPAEWYLSLLKHKEIYIEHSINQLLQLFPCVNFTAIMASQDLKKRLTRREIDAIDDFQKKIAGYGAGKITRLVLFGSRARGEGDEESDIDVLVLISGEDESLKKKIWSAAHRVFCDTDIMISPLVLSAAKYSALLNHERLIAKSVEKEGIPL